MKSPFVIAAVLIVLLGGIGAYAFVMSPFSARTEMNPAQNETTPDLLDTNQMPEPTPQTTETSDTTNSAESAESPQNDTNQYIEFTPEALAASSDTKRVLFFYANWCPTCAQANTRFTNNPAGIPENTTVIRVNYNDTDTSAEEKALADTYNITYQHTFVQIDASGEAVTRWNGGDIEELQENLE